jgi:hypothetical protein
MALSFETDGWLFLLLQQAKAAKAPAVRPAKANLRTPGESGAGAMV